MGWNTLAEGRVYVSDLFASDLAVAASCKKCGPARTAAEVADQTRRQYNQGERRLKERQCEKGHYGKADHDVVLQRPSPDPQHGFEYNRQDRRLQSEEQRLYTPDIAEDGINPT
ncbi:hypothetical protein chiPu_0032315 [Chiloscyllium punctatum]|uniref:Uncharacterized protein n=1 Tax=Chiloscyllium punctatum TaxID=137246 RepID=A0A401U0D2_CHIPU|nr:hypothetical protein [Chiloscyllium punctatum]